MTHKKRSVKGDMALCVHKFSDLAREMEILGVNSEIVDRSLESALAARLMENERNCPDTLERLRIMMAIAHSIRATLESQHQPSQ